MVALGVLLAATLCAAKLCRSLERLVTGAPVRGGVCQLERLLAAFRHVGDDLLGSSDEQRRRGGERQRVGQRWIASV